MDDSHIRRQAPKLFSLQRKNIYQVAPGFFRELEMRIDDSRSPEPRSGHNWKRWMEFSVVVIFCGILLAAAIRLMIVKDYVPVETDRTIYNITDGDSDKEPIFSKN